MKSPDLVYRVTGAFVTFAPKTREGRITCRQLGAKPLPVAKLPSLLAALKRVGIRAGEA